MATEVKLPELGEGIESGDITNISVKPGDSIEEGQTIMEVETDKAVIPVPAQQGGTIEEVLVSDGDTVSVGQTILTLSAGGESGSAPKKQAAPKQEKAEKQEGAQADEKPEPSQSTATATQEPPAAKQESHTGNGEATTERREDTERLPAGPAVRYLARKLNVDLTQISGSGRRGRITPDDVLDFVNRQGSGGGQLIPQPSGGGSTMIQAPSPRDVFGGDLEKFGPVKVEKLPKIRQAIAQQMSLSKTVIPHLTNFDDADVTELERFRKEVDAERIGVKKLTSMPFIIKACALALRERPLMNAMIDTVNNEIIYKEYVHLGIAVDTPAGLMVPVMRDVDKKSVPQLARELNDLAAKARDRKTAVEDMRGGSFTISNMGAIGGQYSTPVINYPEVAILLVGRNRKIPVVVEDEITVRNVMPLSLSYDHRLIDGAEAARFLNIVKAYLQSPANLMIE